MNDMEMHWVPVRDRNGETHIEARWLLVSDKPAARPASLPAQGAVIVGANGRHAA